MNVSEESILSITNIEENNENVSFQIDENELVQMLFSEFVHCVESLISLRFVFGKQCIFTFNSQHKKYLQLHLE